MHGVRHVMHGVRHVSRRPVAVLVLLTTSFKKRSVWLFLSSRSAGWLCPLPDVRHPFGAMRSCLVQLQENKGTRSPCFVAPRFPRCPRKTQTRHWPQGHTASCAFFSSVARRSTARPGHFTSFPSLPIQSLVHWGFVVKPNKCEGILSKVTSRFNDDLGLPKCSARVSAVQRLGVTEF